MTISDNFNISNITVVQGQRRQLDVTMGNITTIMETTIQDVVRRSLNADLSLIAVNITEIDDSSLTAQLLYTLRFHLQKIARCRL